MDQRYSIDYRRNYFFPLDRPDLWTVANLVGLYERWWPWMREVCLYGTEIAEGSISGVRHSDAASVQDERHG